MEWNGSPRTKQTSPSRRQSSEQEKDEKELLRRQADGLKVEDAPSSIFAHADWHDYAILISSSIAAVIAGSLNPLLTVIYGQLVGTFKNFSNNTISGSELKAATSHFTLFFVYLAIAEFVLISAATIGFHLAGERLVKKLREAYLSSIIRQNIAFFDVLSPGQVMDRLVSDTDMVYDGITTKFSLSLTATATFISAFVVGFAEYWQLALILASVLVVVIISCTAGARYATRFTTESRANISLGAAIPMEAISSIRHVIAYGIQSKLSTKYFAHILRAEKYAMKSSAVVSVVMGISYGIPYLSFGLCFWQGARYISRGDIASEGVVTTALAAVIGASAIARVAPSAQALINSIAGANGMMKVMARKSPIDSLSSEGLKLSNLRGEIIFRDVKLCYPSRPDSVVLNGLNLQFPAGKTTAIIGPSGCGKSSILGLLERFYEPVRGNVELDNHNIQSLNVGWLRNQIAYVNQEALLFNMSVFENIKCGLKETNAGTDTVSLVTAAAKSANAHDFIISLPDGYSTLVGERGLRMSGGQRQRIAIARAIVDNPKILLLDEPTAALDTASERLIQTALDSLSATRTTILVAHRLSTVRKAHNILVMSDGRIVEHGNHEALMKRDGFYCRMVKKQQVSSAFEKTHPVIPGSDSDEKNEAASIEPLESIAVAPRGLTMDNLSVPKDSNEKSFVTNDLKKKSGPLSWWALGKLAVQLTGSEHWISCVGLCAAVLSGLGPPVQSIFFGKLIELLSLPIGNAYRERNFWCLMYLMLALVAFIARTLQGMCFCYVSETLTLRARDESFRTILQQDVAFFDEERNSIGALTTFLATGTASLSSLNGAIFGSILAFMATIVGGIVVSLVVGWQLALVCTATVPFVAGCGWMRLKVMSLLHNEINNIQIEATGYASEAIGGIHAVASLCLERRILDRYSEILHRQSSKSLWPTLRASALYAASQSVNFLCAALAFWYGGGLIASGKYSMFQFFICFAALISGSQSAGGIFSFAPDISKALHAGQELKRLLSSRPTINAVTPRARSIGDSAKGTLRFKDITFSYPSRPDHKALKDINLLIPPGQYIGLVGPSGCGKSTVIALIERFFDLNTGRLQLSDHDISSFNIHEYRNKLSLVSQEMTMYQGTIRENIVMGVDHDVSDDDIHRVCKEANILEFIKSLRNGFSTTIGSRGVLLSGGQKQRIAIARALLRNPRILLLDEATSALDSESESIVQDALDTASEHRTTIAVAHRLSTVRKADCIFVINHGQVVESGTHQELMKQQGYYYNLLQSREDDGTTWLET